MNPNSTAKEQSLSPTTVSHHEPKRKSAEQSHVLDERIVIALQAAGDKKALDPVVLDLREIVSFTDFFVLTSGANERQVQAIADEVLERLKKNGHPAARVEGRKTAEWILLDYGDFIVHVFADKARKFYDLERLWREAKRLELPAALVNQTSSLRTE